MSAAELTTILSSVLESGAIITFIVILFRGLKLNIDSLKSTINTQNETLKVMETRIENTEKVGNIYKNLISELPANLDSYKNLVGKLKEDMIAKIDGLNATISAQDETLQVIDRRAEEEKKVGEIYKNLLEGLPVQVEAYKKTIEKIKNDMVSELEKANELKDEELKKLYEMRIQEINKLDELISGVPALRAELISLLDDLQKRFDILNNMEKESGFLVREALNNLRRRK